MNTLNDSARATPYVMPPLLWGADSLTAAAIGNANWLWQGFLAPGAVTLLTSQWKTGKSTLVSVLLSRMKAGGTLAGLAVASGKAVVVSEEGPEHWLRRSHQLDFGDHVGWFCRPFHGKPTPEQWTAFIDGLAALHDRLSFSLVVIDPLAAFLPGSENHSGSMMEALLPLQRLTTRNLSVLVLHHPSKGDPPIGQAARGSGALAGVADILIEMRAASPSAPNDRRRRLWAWSRFPQTPARLVIEWTADGTDYLSLGTFEVEEFTRHWPDLLHLLIQAPHKLTRKDMLNRWTNGTLPDKVSLARWLEIAVDRGLLKKDGDGLRDRPFRYWLPVREEAWRQDPLAYLLMPEFAPKTLPSS